MLKEESFGEPKYYKIEQGTSEWHKLRSRFITASRFSDLKTSIEIRALKTETAKKIIESVAASRVFEVWDELSFKSFAMARGNELESVAAQEYEEKFKEELFEGGFFSNGDIFGASPDRLKKQGLVEIKCPNLTTHIFYHKNDEIPDDYRWQMKLQMLVTGQHECDFVSFFPGTPLFVKRIELTEGDIAYFKMAESIIREFLEEEICYQENLKMEKANLLTKVIETLDL